MIRKQLAMATLAALACLVLAACVTEPGSRTQYEEEHLMTRSDK
ncbi:hypothetical protein [Oryzifoliimicrobium ureilyticus]